ncbi:HAD family hydrolase [Nocardioides sp. 616]|uniref:HAD family hydrolase n=1 Tax=Nocardioides sp. 616 TaxID=2268090 RepID=UPI000CE54CF2|nr:HAD family hydrolase [Nocardioides sp. 616]
MTGEVGHRSPGERPRPRLVATDLDGTLLDAEGRVSPRTREVIAAVEQLGVPVVFVTGRPIRWMEQLWESVGGHGLAICSNGGIVYDVATHSVRTAHPIASDVLVEVGQTLRRAVPGTTFALEKTGGFAREAGFLPRRATSALPEVPTGPLEQIADDTVVKLLARHEELAPEEFWSVVEEAVGTRVTTTWSSIGALVEMSAAGVTKATTLARLCADLGVAPEEVVAFGDMPNDLPLLEWAGSSYAMANAHPTVLALADHTAPAHHEDGVAETLSAIFGLGPGSG